MGWDDREARFEARPVRSTIWGMSVAAFLALIAVILVGVISVLVWLFSVFTSDVKGQGDAQKMKNAAPNRIQAQEQFEGRFQEIKAIDQIITMSAATLALDPGNERLKNEFNGQQQYCVQLIGKYNADARKFTRADFRAADLPAEIDTFDRHTDCKP